MCVCVSVSGQVIFSFTAFQQTFFFFSAHQPQCLRQTKIIPATLTDGNLAPWNVFVCVCACACASHSWLLVPFLVVVTLKFSPLLLLWLSKFKEFSFVFSFFVFFTGWWMVQFASENSRDASQTSSGATWWYFIKRKLPKIPVTPAWPALRRCIYIICNNVKQDRNQPDQP